MYARCRAILDFSTALEVLVGETKEGGSWMPMSGALRLIADAAATGRPDRCTSLDNYNENLRITHEIKDEFFVDTEWKRGERKWSCYLEMCRKKHLPDIWGISIAGSQVTLGQHK